MLEEFRQDVEHAATQLWVNSVVQLNKKSCTWNFAVTILNTFFSGS